MHYLPKNNIGVLKASFIHRTELRNKLVQLWGELSVLMNIHDYNDPFNPPIQ